MNAIYVRQSIDKKDSLSIEGQTALCRKFAGDDARVFADRGFSGKNTNRPAFTALIQEVKAGKIQKIFVYRLDRFSRSIADFSRLWELMERCHVQFNSVTEQFDTSAPIGRAMLNIVLVFAQLERETIAERVRDNYAHRFRLGAWPGGPAPYGYRIVRIPQEGKTVPALEADRDAEIVSRIFREYAAEDTSLRSVAKLLNEAGIPGPKRAAWDSAALSRILRSPIYVRADGDVYWYYRSKGVQIEHAPEAFDGMHACNMLGRRLRAKERSAAQDSQMLTISNHTGIVSSALWLSVQEKLDALRQIPRCSLGKHSWLTGLLKCEKCGYAVKISYIKSADRYYFSCSGRSNLSRCDASFHLDLRELERQIALEIGALLESVPSGAKDVGTEERAAEILEIDHKIERLLAAAAECSEVSAAYLSNEIERLHEKRDLLLKQGGKHGAPPKRPDFNAATDKEKRVVAAELIDRILLNGSSAHVIWNI